ncbi:hypothetical protein UlMin_020729 [Ulmus minor]
MEFVSPEGLHLDGCHPMEMRQIRVELDSIAKLDGSALFEMGNTKVIAVVYGPRELVFIIVILATPVHNRSQQLSDQKPVTLFLRSMKISIVIRQTMEACILTRLMPRSQIDIFVQVLQAYGDVGIPMRDLITSYSAGYLNNTLLLDSAGGPNVIVGILPKLDKVTLIQRVSKFYFHLLSSVIFLCGLLNNVSHVGIVGFAVLLEFCTPLYQNINNETLRYFWEKIKPQGTKM